MKYMGSKSRIAKDIVPIIQNEIDCNNIKTYIEPFVGGGNVIDKIRCENKIGSDKHKYLIAMFTNLDLIETLPEYISKEHYSNVRECYNNQSDKYPDWYIGAVGFLASYNAKFFGGWAGIVHTKAGTDRNYYDEAKRNLLKQIPNLKDVSFSCCDYKEYTGYKDCLFYLDIPYKDTTSYTMNKAFNHDEFWDWCRELSKDNIVMISEHIAPDDFNCIWSAPVKRTLDNAKRIDVVERLFRKEV